MDWLLYYLLIGFVLSWVAQQMYHNTSARGVKWKQIGWELVVTLCWPFAFVYVFVGVIMEMYKKPRRH